MAERHENEDFVEVRSFSFEGPEKSFVYIAPIVKSVIGEPLHKTRLVIDLVVLEGRDVLDACVNAVSICLLQCGIPLLDTLSSAAISSDGCCTTMVYGTFTGRVFHMSCEGCGSFAGALVRAREQCKANARAIQDHLVAAVASGEAGIEQGIAGGSENP